MVESIQHSIIGLEIFSSGRFTQGFSVISTDGSAHNSRIGDQRKLMRDCASALSRRSLRRSYTHSNKVSEQGIDFLSRLTR